MTTAQAERIQVAIIEGELLPNLTEHERAFLHYVVIELLVRINRDSGPERAADVRRWAETRGYIPSESTTT